MRGRQRQSGASAPWARPDLMTPVMDGRRFRGEHAKDPVVPVIVMSAFDIDYGGPPQVVPDGEMLETICRLAAAWTQGVHLRQSQPWPKARRTPTKRVLLGDDDGDIRSMAQRGRGVCLHFRQYRARCSCARGTLEGVATP